MFLYHFLSNSFQLSKNFFLLQCRFDLCFLQFCLISMVFLFQFFAGFHQLLFHLLPLFAISCLSTNISVFYFGYSLKCLGKRICYLDTYYETNYLHGEGVLWYKYLIVYVPCYVNGDLCKSPAKDMHAEIFRRLWTNICNLLSNA